LDPRETFRASFVDTAKRRFQRITSLLERAESVELRSAASELRCLAGEAMMLDYGAVADAARVAEQAALAGDRHRIRDLLDELSAAIQRVA